MAKVIHPDELEQHRKALPQPVSTKSAKAKPTESEPEETNVLTGSAPPDLKYTPSQWPREWTDDALTLLLRLIPKNRHWISNAMLGLKFRRQTPPEYFCRPLKMYPEHKTADDFSFWIFLKLIEHLEQAGRLERRWSDDTRWEARKSKTAQCAPEQPKGSASKSVAKAIKLELVDDDDQAVLKELKALAKKIGKELKELEGLAQVTTKDALREGELYAGLKQKCKHGEWLPLLEKNVTWYPVRTVQRRIDAWNRYCQRKNDNLSYLAEAVKLLPGPKKEQEKPSAGQTEEQCNQDAKPQDNASQSPDAPDTESEQRAGEQENKERATRWRCECGQEFDTLDEAITLYECGECGNIGQERRCEGCNKFCRKLTDQGCPECQQAALEEMEPEEEDEPASASNPASAAEAPEQPKHQSDDDPEDVADTVDQAIEIAVKNAQKSVKPGDDERCYWARLEEKFSDWVDIARQKQAEIMP